MDRSADHLPQPWTRKKRRDPRGRNMRRMLVLGDRKLHCDVANLANKERSGRRMVCERPFGCSDTKKNSKYKYKLQTRNNLKRLFAAPGLVVSPAAFFGSKSKPV